MKHILGIATATLMGASVLAAPALAESPMEMTPAERGETTAPLPDVDTGTTAAISASVEEATSAITGSASAARMIEETADFANITVAQIGTAPGGQVQQVVNENQQSVDELQAAIAANATVESELAAQNVDTSSVVGAQVAANGDLVLFVM